MTTNDDIKARVERARELDAQATRGPWGFYQPMEFPKDWRISTGPNEPPYWIGRLTKAQASGLGSEPPREEDARFIAESRTLLPALAADCERLQGEVQDVDARRESLVKQLFWSDCHRKEAEQARDREKEREESLREQLATAQRERDQARVTAAKLNRRAQQLESELAAHRKDGRHSDLVQRSRALRRDLDQAKDHVRILSRFQRALEKGVSTDPADSARVHQILQQEADEQQRELVAWKAKAAQAEQSLAETAQLMVLAKDTARNATPILRLHKQLVAAAKANDDQAVNRIVAELGLMESPL